VPDAGDPPENVVEVPSLPVVSVALPLFRVTARLLVRPDRNYSVPPPKARSTAAAPEIGVGADRHDARVDRSVPEYVSVPDSVGMPPVLPRL
jgi:hypothetical protein